MNLQLVCKALVSTEKCCLHGVLSCCVASLFSVSVQFEGF